MSNARATRSCWPTGWRWKAISTPATAATSKGNRSRRCIPSSRCAPGRLTVARRWSPVGRWSRSGAPGWRPARSPSAGSRRTTRRCAMLADGRALAAGQRGYVLPPGARTVRLLSRTQVPQEQWPDSEDRRRLGVALREVRFDGVSAPPAAFGRGFHAAEPDWRWTNGDATLAVPPGARRLTFARVAIGGYAVAAEASKAGQSPALLAYSVTGAFIRAASVGSRRARPGCSQCCSRSR
jgi:hypothetical protein